MATKKTRPNTADHVVLAEMRVRKGKGTRTLTETEIEYLIQMFAVTAEANDLDALALAPDGSFLRMAARHFTDTDISFALPIMQVVMIAASKLTQSGASLSVPGLGQIIPTTWTIGLAESGSAKTLAADEIWNILGGNDNPPVQKMPDSGSDAQWIIELAQHNGSYWQQDEVGKRINAILTQKNWERAKPWMLDAYSYQAISNRLKGEKVKLEIRSPHFTFHGLSVFSTWKHDIDASSMLDGFCQRFNYYIADRRTDTDMYDHFLYFANDNVDASRQRLKATWDALCNQREAFGVYRLDDEVIPYLNTWWRGLRNTIGQSGLPPSFVRRIGFSLMRYLIVLQFLLGKSRYPVDLETAILATKYAQYHMLSALVVLHDYDKSTASYVQKVAALRNDILVKGGKATVREITRKLSASQRANLPTSLVKQIVEVLDKLEGPTDLFEVGAARTVKRKAMCSRRDSVADRLQLNERKRNERRLRNLRAENSKCLEIEPDDILKQMGGDGKIVPLTTGRASSSIDIDPFDLTG